MDDAQQFYDDLSNWYHLIYEDWEHSIERQGTALAEVIRARQPDATRVADVACGIGTQSLALAQRGFHVIGSDLSPRAIERARQEAATRNLAIDFRVDDMQHLATYGDASADVLLACDNAVPHLLSDGEIEAAFRRFHQVLKPNGICIVSVRDYAAIEHERFRFIPHGVREWDAQRVAVFQVWAFDGPHYELSLYFVFDDGQNVTTHVYRTTYYAISIARLTELARAAGFVKIERIDDVFFQPLLVATRPSS